MAKFKVEVEWSGYSRGYSVYLVEADTKEEAEEIGIFDGERIKYEVVRDDTEKEVVKVTKENNGETN